MKSHRDSMGRGEAGSPASGRGVESSEGAVLEASLDELREFLEADLLDVYADLEFKETLRQKLWELVQARNRLRSHG